MAKPPIAGIITTKIPFIVYINSALPTLHEVLHGPPLKVRGIKGVRLVNTLI